MAKQTPLLLSLLLSFFLPSIIWAQEFQFDISEIEKKPYQLSGYLELRPALLGLDRDAALHQLRFYKRDEGKTLEEFNTKLQMEGSYEKGIGKLFIRTNSDLAYSYLGWDHKTSLYEGYLSVKPSPSLTIDLGKKTFKWGKGYAWNPVAFIDRPKNPDDPDLALEGFWTFSADYIKSFAGPLKTFSLTPVVFPVYHHINDDFGRLDRINVAARIYLLLYDTDLDFVFFIGKSRTNRLGIDFSRNITTNFEIHGEFALVNNQKKRVIDSLGRAFESEEDAKSYLLGIRYLTKSDTTFIFEYYRNGAGFNRVEMKDYFSLVNRGYDSYQSTGDDSLLKKAQGVTEGNYGRINPMKDYLYLRISQKEPFNILYFTPSVTAILNLNDKSFSVLPELLYTGVTNLELRMKAGFLFGEKRTEFGEKQNDYRIEFRVRYYFDAIKLSKQIKRKLGFA